MRPFAQIISDFNPQALRIDINNRFVYALNIKLKMSNKRYRKQGASDGLPLPSARLVYLVSGQYNVEAFYNNGIQGFECIKAVLRKNGLYADTFKNILDFGCGCGRITRHWKQLNRARIYGVDYNAGLLGWCRKNLPFASYEINKPMSMLRRDSGVFDFIYAASVFTHLSEQPQTFWIQELKRVLKPGGIFLITVHGMTRLNQLPETEKRRFLAGKPVIVGRNFSGTNFCCVYHPEQYVKNNIARGFKLLDFLPGGAKDTNQDMYLFQK
jgi:SAM-dependent methyltransferase